MRSNTLNCLLGYTCGIPAAVCCVLIHVVARIPLLSAWIRATPLQIAAIISSSVEEGGASRVERSRMVIMTHSTIIDDITTA